MVRFGVCTLVFLALAFVVVSPVVAQEWSAEQKDVWAFETAYWNAVAARDLAAVMSHVHDSYRGWSYDGSVPGSKELTKMAMSHSFPITKSFGHYATPLAILVSGNTAVVHYYIGFHGTNEKGDHESTQDRWTDTLVKEGGKWLLLADHGGDVSKLK